MFNFLQQASGALFEALDKDVNGCCSRRELIDTCIKFDGDLAPIAEIEAAFDLAQRQQQSAPDRPGLRHDDFYQQFCVVLESVEEIKTNNTAETRTGKQYMARVDLRFRRRSSVYAGDNITQVEIFENTLT